VDKLDSENLTARGLEGTEYHPGYVGLNNLKLTDFINVIVQGLSKTSSFRDYFLLQNKPVPANIDNKELLVIRIGELFKKMWNPWNFKSHVSPHEFLQAVYQASEKKFRIGEQKDPLAFLTWLLNTLN